MAVFAHMVLIIFGSVFHLRYMCERILYIDDACMESIQCLNAILYLKSMVRSKSILVGSLNLAHQAIRVYISLNLICTLVEKENLELLS